MARLVEDDLRSYYHCVSRVVDGRYIFGDEEKRFFRKIMRGLEHLTGVRILTYCLMSNHFHLLLEVPADAEIRPSEEVSDKELVSLIRPLYGQKKARQVALELANCDQHGFAEKKEKIRQSYLDRRGKLDVFMKELKQRFTRYYNWNEGRRGTLWEGRFKSVIVGNSDEALLAMSAYIDLNPVRAGIVDDPADFVFSGYGEACGGSRRARCGLGLALQEERQVSWEVVQSSYRKLLYGVGVESGVGEGGQATRYGFSHDEAIAVLESGGRLPMWQALRCRVRYLTDGAIFGGERFVERVFQRNRDVLASPNRDSGPRAMRGSQWGELRILRDLRVNVFS